MTLPWSAFESLEGDPKRNFELLMRGAVRRNYGRYGRLRSRRNQPGVEFHLQLDADCDLGQRGQWFGWQCKYYDLPQSKALGKTRRDEIEDAILKAKADVPGMTDFVLCLKELPKKADLDWYDSEVAPPDGMRLHRVADEDIETLLTGDATILRATFFGELIVDTAGLTAAHARAVEPVRQRWVPHLHVITSVERRLCGALLRPGSASHLQEQSNVLAALGEALERARMDVADADTSRLLELLIGDLSRLATRLERIATACDLRRPDEAVELLAESATPTIKVREVDLLARRLRVLRHPSATAGTTARADLRHALRLLAELRDLSVPCVLAVVADAGTGKSHLAAELTAARDGVPGGIFIRGSELARGSTLDTLAQRVPGIDARSFERLLEASDALGARAGARIPIVIDGLNEAQRPADWRTLLAETHGILDRYPNVRLILTYRGAVREDIRSPGLTELELELEDVEIREAARRYFNHYKIDPGQARLPMRLFGQLLYLRLFCEATNGDAEQWVGVEALPGSLVAVFERYVAQTTRRLGDRPGHPMLPHGHIEKKLAAFAQLLWDRQARDVPWDEAKLLFDGDAAEWDHSLLKALEQEGVLFRDDRLGHDAERSAVLFDRLSGYLIAYAITRGLRFADAEQVLGQPALWDKLTGSARHPLANDILVSLVGLMPRRFPGHQLWKVAPEHERDLALLRTMDLESRFLDAETVDALCVAVAGYGPPQHPYLHPFDRLWELRDGLGHCLNARFLDRVLRSMPVAQRDLAWTEWIRDSTGPLNDDWLQADIETARTRWESSDVRDEADDLEALAIAWLLSSTVMPLRDAATRALQRYGRVDPRRLFALAADLFDVDDPYVSERACAAAFGAAVYHQMPDPGGAFERALGEWLALLAVTYLGASATCPTSHQLTRMYVAACFELAGALHPAALPVGVDPSGLTFGSGPRPDPIQEEDPRTQEVATTVRMDFENYIIGPLHEGRSNYDSQHLGFRKSLSEVRGRVWELGWRSELFEQLDGRLAEDRWRAREPAATTERYGKKYGWIAYYELAGRLADAGQGRERSSGRRYGIWPDIDPSFPVEPPQAVLTLPAWATAGPDDPEEWMRSAEVLVPDELLRPNEINGVVGPWLLVEGYLNHTDAARNREVWGFVRGVLVAEAEHGELVAILEDREYLGNELVPSAPPTHTTFAGEIPWSPWCASGMGDDEERAYREQVRAEWDDDGAAIELLGHEYGFEGSRTVTVEASGHYFPSLAFAEHHKLRQRPGTLSLVTLDGSHASLTLSAPDGWEGRLLYLRSELVAAYADDRRLVQLAWGERQAIADWSRGPDRLPDWMRAMGHRNLWRRIVPDALR